MGGENSLVWMWFFVELETAYQLSWQFILHGVRSLEHSELRARIRKPLDAYRLELVTCQMLEHTFLHIPGVGPRTERRLWDTGIRRWVDLLDRVRESSPGGRFSGLISHVQESERRLQAGDPHFFARGLPSNELWRLFREFRESLAYLDIETTGMWAGLNHITTIALYDGHTVRTYIHGDNLWEFAQDVRGYKVLVTYNGRCFDLPFIREAMGLRLDQVHIDLRFLLASLGFRGGLKGCERAMGIDRGDLEGMNGYFAVLLWDAFVRGRDPRALETLLAYNVQDAVSLEHLMVRAYNLKLSQTPFAPDLCLPAPASPPVQFRPDHDLMERIRARIQSQGQ